MERRRRRRPRRLRIARPTAPLADVPPEGMAPVETGNALLDLNQNLTNEWESRTRREEALLRTTLQSLRGTSEVWGVPAILAVSRVGLIVLAATGVTVVTASVDGPLARVIVGGSVGLGALVALLVLMVPFGVVAFGSATSAGLARTAGRRRSVPGLFADAVRAWRLLGRLAVARVLGVFGAFYQALMVFVVPAGLAEGLPYGEAQRRSEELVRLRWGAGRFRALGIPRMVPANAAYSFLVRRFGYRGVLIEVAIVVGVLLVPAAVVGITRSPAAFLVASGLTWGPVILAGVAWGWLIQPVLDGWLRAHLYRYAVTGEASPPYSAELLHACLREELRAKFGKPQRDAGERHPDAGGSSGLRGVAARLGARGLGSVRAEAGMSTQDLRRVADGVGDLWSDSRAVMAAVRSTPGAGREDLIAITGLTPGRCDAALGNLLNLGHIDETGEGEVAGYAPTRRRRSWWEVR